MIEEGKIIQNAFEKILIIYENSKKDALRVSEAASYDFHPIFVQVPNIDAVILVYMAFMPYGNVIIIAT